MMMYALSRRLVLTGLLATSSLSAFSGLNQNARADSVPNLDASTTEYLAGLPLLTKTPLEPLAGRPTIITFFATWCPPCRPEFEALNRIHREFRETNLAIIAINAFEAMDGLSTNGSRRRFYGVTQPTFPIIDGNQDATTVFGGITRIPTLLIYDRKGTISYQFVHEKDATVQYVGYQEIKQRIQPLL